MSGLTAQPTSSARRDKNQAVPSELEVAFARPRAMLDDLPEPADLFGRLFAVLPAENIVVGLTAGRIDARRRSGQVPSVPMKTDDPALCYFAERDSTQSRTREPTTKLIGNDEDVWRDYGNWRHKRANMVEDKAAIGAACRNTGQQDLAVISPREFRRSQHVSGRRCRRSASATINHASDRLVLVGLPACQIAPLPSI